MFDTEMLSKTQPLRLLHFVASERKLVTRESLQGGVLANQMYKEEIHSKHRFSKILLRP